MTNDKDQDPQAKAIENNPCGICRALGLPVCKGHGAKGGGGGDATDETSEENDTSKAADNTPTLKDLTAIFAESTLWAPMYIDDDCYTYNEPHALFSIKLDLNAGSLVFTKRDGLSKEEQQQLEKFLDVIENELNSFKAELNAEGIDTQSFQCHRENGNLTIKIPNPAYFDTFIQQLIKKNLLPTDSPQKKYTTEVANEKQQDEQKAQAEVSTAPTPFDINKGPKIGE